VSDGRVDLPEFAQMPATIREDARAIRKLIREAEAVSDEVMIACARLKQAMVRARQNPDISVDAGQRALMRLNQAESQALGLSTSLLRVHDELSRIGRETLGGEEGSDTVIAGSAIAPPEPAIA
jgi:mevalonate kinase